MPNSCRDLLQIGHRQSGLYSVMGAKQVETLYCDFTQTPGDEDFQRWVGFNDVKSKPTYFHVSRALPYNETITPIPFTRAILNQGGAMNKETGKFTAPVGGVYFFYFTGTVFLPTATSSASSTRSDFTMCLFKNSNCVEWLLERPDEISTGNRHERIALQSTVNLKQGDQIWLAIGKKKSPGGYLVGDALTNFKGFLIQEDISQSLYAVP
ncbi:C1q and tumor necrosis factor-related protein 5 [Daphnia pulex]|uniref:C1q and tumor necrosis factor-related protein 5 n=1 Tax=Daphnia pulex TaxID=6669 RepID=E9GQQ6_DAPPU|nr:C1q and tumor necrosis factor-related protein 5 [Daphnia pulex]|eukprot:EFX78288.1 C1q and tumor necrosis factor-related protein 5 [Daphnia pulex]